MLDEDEVHRTNQSEGKCDKTIARRLYIRDYYLNSSRLAVSQSFIPVGVICITCGFNMGSLLAALRYTNNRSRLGHLRDDAEIHDQALEQALYQAQDQLIHRKILTKSWKREFRNWQKQK